jgi:hypothetical protein
MKARRRIPRKYRKYQARPPRIGYAREAVQAYVNEIRYRKYRKHVLAAVAAWMLVRKLRGTR